MNRNTTAKCRIAVIGAAMLLAAAGPVSAANLTWTGPGGTTTSPTSGTWDTTSLNWNNGSGSVAFTSSANTGAIFGGVDGAYGIQCDTALTVSNILFSNSGYDLTNSAPVTITVGNTSGMGVTVATGKTATIDTNVTISGASGLNPFYYNPGVTAAGTLIIQNGGVFTHPGNQQFDVDGAPGSEIRVMPGGTFLNNETGSKLRVGITANSSPLVSVEGGSFIFTASGPYLILGAGNNTTGTVTLVSGIVSNTLTSPSIVLGSGSPSSGIINLNGGTLTVQNITTTAGTPTGILNLNGGTLQGSANNTLLAAAANLTANVRNANSTIDNNGFSITYSQPLVHSTISGDAASDGGLTFTGAGTTILTATNTYNGPTYVQNGTLNLGVPTGSLASSSIGIGAGSGSPTLVLSNRVLNISGTFGMTNGAVQFQIFNFPTNLTVGTLALGGSANTVNIPIIVGGGVIPQTTTIIKYGTLAPGAVDANNNLTTLALGTLPNGFTGYVTNNVTKHTIDLVLTGGSLAPYIAANPVSVARYPGATVQFSVTAFGATSIQWRTNGVAVHDGGNFSGTATSVITITDITAANGLNYDVVLSNASGSSTSTVAQLTVVIPDCAYEATVVSNGPTAYYRFNETGDPVNAYPLTAFDYAGGYNAIYGATVLNVFYGIYGPQPSTGYPGFDNNNGAAQLTPGASYAASSLVIVSNGISAISTNTVTLITWVYPLGTETGYDGLIFNRGGSSVVGLGYSGSTDVNGNYTLGYNWDDDANTWNWNSGLVPPVNQWSLVALVVTATNATIYVGTTNGLSSSVQTYAHPVQTLNGPLVFGDDTSGASGSRIFNGDMDEVAMFGYALSQNQILQILGSAVGSTNFPPVITQQPNSVTNVVGDVAEFSVTASGTPPLSYQWQGGANGVYTNLTDGPLFTGSETATLSIDDVSLTSPASYIVIVTNYYGSVTSNPAMMTVLASRGVVTLTAGDTSGNTSFNAAGGWSNASAPTYVNDYVDDGFLLRTPTSGTTTFAGHSLTISNGTLAFKTTGGVVVGTSFATGLFLDAGTIGGWNASASTLGGYVTLTNSGATFDPQIYSTLEIAAPIAGDGPLIVASGTSQYGGTVALLASNSYSGGTQILAVDKLQLTGPGTLGSVNAPLTMTVTQGVTSGSTVGTLDLNGTSQGVGNLSGNGNAVILNSATSTTNSLTVGNGNATGGDFQGSLSAGGGVLSLVKVGTGTITLSGTNTFVGPTWLNNGTLALSGGATLSGTPLINLASGTTFDVSGMTAPFSLASGQTLAGSGATGTINGSLDAGSGAFNFTYASGTPTFTVTGGTLTMNNNAITVTNTGAALPVGSYKIISKGSGGSVAGLVSSSAVTVAGGGVAAGATSSLTINGGELYLTVGSGSPVIITTSYHGSTLTLNWPGGWQLLQATNLLGPWTTNNTATSPFSLTPSGPKMFFRVQQ